MSLEHSTRAKVALMANLSHYGSDALAEVHNHDNVNTNMINQAVQAMPSFEQSNAVNHSETKITSDRNIIPYSQIMSQNSVNSPKPTLSSRPTKVEVPQELPKVNMVNASLKKLKHHLAGFDVVIKERTTATTITEGSWGFEHTKSYFRDEIIPFVKALKDLFNTFNQYLVDELYEVQNVFHQMEQAVEQHLISKDIVNIIVNSSVDNASVNVHECKKYLKLETELQKDFIEKEIYDKLFKSYTTLEKHCISLEVDTQLNQEIFQRDNSFSNQNAPSFDQYFELNELKAQSQEKDTVIKKLKERIRSLCGNMNENKVKKDIEEIETINIELDHRVSKLIAENEHLKQTYKQLYDSIKPARIRLKEQCDDLINQVNIKSVEISDLKASLQEKVLVITTLKDDLMKLKGKALADNVVMKHSIDLEILKIDVEYLNPRFLNNRSAHSDYLKHTQEEAVILKEIVEQGKSQNPLNTSLDSACKYTKQIQELLIIIGQTCPSFNNSNEKLVAITPKNKDKGVKFTKRVTSSGNTITKLASTSNLKNSKRKVWKPTGKVFTNIGYTWRPTGRTFTIVGNASPLTMITTTTEVPLRKPTTLNNETTKPVITLVYSRKPKKSNTNVPVSKYKALKSVSGNKNEPSQTWGSIVSDVPSSSLDECKLSKLFFDI
ncbi:hypothetical protein Tco_1090220 [Tanacetum coccineum]|uniref:Uncharacterized protein n=1 Tax=Tanacetum coccineum TaxID=301880 RepID=A0ABQ5I5S3_9ASTR